MTKIKFSEHSRKQIVKTEKGIEETCEIHGVSRSWLYELKSREKLGISLETKSSRPKNIKTKPRPECLTEEFVKSHYIKYKNPGYQRFYLQAKKDYPELNFGERDIRKIYEENNWIKRKKEKEKIIRYEKESPGDMAHTDLKYLPVLEGQRTYFQELLDDCTRMTSVSILFNKEALTARDGLRKSYDDLSIEFQRLLQDNGAETSYNCLRSSRRPKDKLHPVVQFCKDRGITPKYTRPCRPQTNGKSERLHKTLEDEVLPLQRFDSLQDMFNAIELWLKWYNEERIHMSLKMTPLQKMKLLKPDYIPPVSYLSILNSTL